MARDVAKLYGFGCFGLIVVLFVGAVLLRRSYSRCPPEIDARVPGPDSSYVAMVFHFECGFGRKGTSNVSIEPAGREPSYPANLFVAMDSSGMNILRGRPVRPVVEITWDAPTAITVRYQAGSQIILRNPAAHGISARYAEKE